jgi:hypothetical protein
VLHALPISPSWGHWICKFTYSFQPHCGPGIDSTSKEMGARNLPLDKGRPAGA